MIMFPFRPSSGEGWRLVRQTCSRRPLNTQASLARGPARGHGVSRAFPTRWGGPPPGPRHRRAGGRSRPCPRGPCHPLRMALCFQLGLWQPVPAGAEGNRWGAGLPAAPGPQLPPWNAGNEAGVQGRLFRGRKAILSRPFLFWHFTGRNSVQELLRGAAALSAANLFSWQPLTTLTLDQGSLFPSRHCPNATHLSLQWPQPTQPRLCRPPCPLAPGNPGDSPTHSQVPPPGQQPHPFPG